MILISGLLTLLGAILALFICGVVIFAINAPVETLAWWTGRARCRSLPPTPVALPPPQTDHPPADRYIVYLSGVGRTSGEEHVEKEENFLNMVEAAVPGAVIVRDVFPYSVSNTPLTEHRPLKKLWMTIPKIARRNRRLMILYHILFYRGLLQVMVSRDSRYGTVYGYGHAKEIMRGLLRCGYRPDQPRPVIILCISGGGQTSQTAAPYLKQWLGAPIRIISVGSVLTDHPGLDDVEHVYHLSGSRDKTQYLGHILCVGCWPIFPHAHSSWHRAVAEGRIERIPVGPMFHMGTGDYFSRSYKLADGTPYVKKTAEVVIGLLNGQDAPHRDPIHEPQPAANPELNRKPGGFLPVPEG
jgi:hypothetical protein